MKKNFQKLKIMFMKNKWQFKIFANLESLLIEKILCLKWLQKYSKHLPSHHIDFAMTHKLLYISQIGNSVNII